MRRLVVLAALSLALLTPGALAAISPGAPAPDFSLKLLDGSGKTVTLAGLRGKAVVLLFWAPW
ncbi:MAG: redoxin domain-containing protein [Armatimonadetes bacterium]|nr:redoxin domain-containing protein [Armatimonadota bacterium]